MGGVCSGGEERRRGEEWGWDGRGGGRARRERSMKAADSHVRCSQATCHLLCQASPQVNTGADPCVALHRIGRCASTTSSLHVSPCFPYVWSILLTIHSPPSPCVPLSVPLPLCLPISLSSALTPPFFPSSLPHCLCSFLAPWLHDSPPPLSSTLRLFPPFLFLPSPLPLYLPQLNHSITHSPSPSPSPTLPSPSPISLPAFSSNVQEAERTWHAPPSTH